MRISLIPVILSASLMTASPAQEAPHTPATASPEYQAILKPALSALVSELGKPARLDVKSLRVVGEWSFLYAAMQSPGGQPIDYHGTPFAEAAEAGMKSRTYVALLRGRSESWSLVASAVGPTDVAWADWSTQYAAPAAIFDIPQ